MYILSTEAAEFKSVSGEPKTYYLFIPGCAQLSAFFITFSMTFGGVGRVEGDGQKLYHRANYLFIPRCAQLRAFFITFCITFGAVGGVEGDG